MTSTTRILLLRHGQIEVPAEDAPRLLGWWDPPLGRNGRCQASALASALTPERGIGALYASPLRRAHETAERISGALGMPVIPLAHVREICCGAVDGWTVDAVRRVHPQLWAQHQRQEDDRLRWPGGESYRELRARALRAMRTLAHRHRGTPVLVVTHAGPISQIVGWIHGTSPARWGDHRPGHASVTELAWSPGSSRLLRFDDRSHLLL